MKKNIKKIGIILFIVLIIIAICNIYSWIVSGKQYIKINTASKLYTNSDLHVSVIAQENNVDLETKTQIKLLNSKGRKVKGVKVKYDGNNATLNIPNVEAGNYFLEATVSSKAGKDTVKKEIYLLDGNRENITITLDKGIYKPGDTINYRALFTNQEDDKPISNEVNVSIYDGNDNKVYNENVKSSDYGIISGKFSLASEVNSGLYKIVIKSNNNETTKQFKVNPYITPKYEVKIKYDKENYLVGETAKITFDAKYFFGEAVQNSDLTIYINNEEYQKIKTDSQGIAILDYEIKEAKTYNIKVEAVDTSNYFVDSTSSFTAGTDIFEIQLLPEYGTLVAGKSNDIYVFTKKADGTPVKTYVTVASKNFTKQVATDENGIGKFSVDVEQLENNKNNNTTTENLKHFSIVAEDMNGNTVRKNIGLNKEQKNLLVSTDKVKYEQNEDIKINISSVTENAKNVYFFKNDKLIKMLSTDTGEATINLDDNYGLIDIFVTEKISNNKSYNNSKNTNKYKKTIFIKPAKKLDINISTDKEEYRPGDKINISFETVDETKTQTDTALLVSMLDNSILNLASNDLSIDNIKLALQDINFSDDLDAATLYSCIAEDKSEQTIMALLLKQKSKDISITETGMYNTEQEKNSAIISIILLSIIGIITIVTLFIKIKPLRKAIKHIINFIILDFSLTTIAIFIVNSIMDSYYSANFWLVFALSTVIGLIIYILFIARFNKKIFRTSISIIITFIAVILLALEYSIIYNIIDYGATIVMILIPAVIVLILVVLAKISEAKNLKIKKYTKLILKEIIYILKYICSVAISIMIGSFILFIIKLINYDTWYFMDSSSLIAISIIFIYIFNYLFNIRKKEKEESANEELKEDLNTEFHLFDYKMELVFAIIGAITFVVIVIALVIAVFKQASGSIDGYGVDTNLMDEVAVPSRNSSTNTNSSSSSFDPQTMQGGSNTNTSSVKSIGESPFGFLDSITDSLSSNTSNSMNEVEKNSSQPAEQVEKVTDNKIRNIFLESMCFIPELVTENGKAQLDLDLSDNITTWTIQTVGNTKEGRIGYGMLNNVKVFKEFFVDFELPKNLVETDKVSIPITVHNYTESPISTVLKINQEDWFTIENNNITVDIEAKSTNMVYVPITVLKSGNNKFRAEVSSNSLTDIVEKECQVSTKGYKVEKVVSTGSLDKDITEDILLLEDTIENTAKAKVKIYSSTMSQTIEGMENIFKMPTGCFEQISSTLYPNILALKYLEDNKIVNEEIKQKALSYITSGYQKILTYEVMGESGGYSLYGHSPAETVLTAYGLMEITDLSKVYNVDDKVIEKMTNYLYKNQNSNGSFTITGSHLGGAGSSETLALNAYISWALSESNPNDGRLSKSVEYLKGKINDIDDNYTLALVANTLANVKDKELNNVLKRLVSNINIDGNNAYITSKIVDYYGSRANVQNIQTVALTSLALSKGAYSSETNKLLINYLISKKDARGTWSSTQATILALKAINERNDKNKLQNQTITVKVNQDEQKIEIKDNPIELYELTFGNLQKENKLNIDIEKGGAYYEVIEEYYIPYEKVNTKDNKIEVQVESNNELKVNEILKSNIKVINRSDSSIKNGMVTISIPQGFSVIEDSLMLLEKQGIIEKYETTYSAINIYLRNFDISQIVNLDISFRANYPVEITGMSVRAYDYYNPEIEGNTAPIKIHVTQ